MLIFGRHISRFVNEEILYILIDSTFTSYIFPLPTITSKQNLYQPNGGIYFNQHFNSSSVYKIQIDVVWEHITFILGLFIWNTFGSGILHLHCNSAEVLASFYNKESVSKKLTILEGILEIILLKNQNVEHNLRCLSFRNYIFKQRTYSLINYALSPPNFTIVKFS